MNKKQLQALTSSQMTALNSIAAEPAALVKGKSFVGPNGLKRWVVNLRCSDHKHHLLVLSGRGREWSFDYGGRAQCKKQKHLFLRAGCKSPATPINPTLAQNFVLGQSGGEHCISLVILREIRTTGLASEQMSAVDEALCSHSQQSIQTSTVIAFT